MTKYNKEKYKGKCDLLFKLIEAKKSALSVEKFRFQGDPIYTDQHQVHPTTHQYEVEPYKKDIINSKLVIDEPIEHLVLRNIHQSVVVVDNRCSSINLQGGDNSIIGADITGTISITGMENCLLILNCHQLRLHELRNCAVLTHHVTTNIIMENCTAMKFSSNAKVDDFNFNFTESANYTRTSVEPQFDFTQPYSESRVFEALKLVLD